MARQYQRCRTIRPLDRGEPCHGRLDRIGRPPGIQVRHQPQRGGLLHALVGWSVLTQPDGVVGKDEDYPRPHQRRDADGVAGVLGKHEERAAVRNVAAMHGDAVHDRRHAEFAHSVGNVVAAGLPGHPPGARPVGQVRASEICGAAQQFGERRGKSLDGVLRSLAAGDAFTLGVNSLDDRSRVLYPACRQFSFHTALELGGFLRVGRPVLRELGVPLGLQGTAALSRVPCRVDFLGDLERRMVPADRWTRGGYLCLAQWRTVRIVSARLAWRAHADDCLAAD